ncbi:hypothetical protein FOL47_004208 [Perkinsus chesapeaki]|uniref:Cilia- and flagella-associated protein 69 ARM repeats domain-containing protein n=1 Tax=Perkinsus chesapeaki TaxID=330153 RepID=A0A7J6M3T9_PERCH|nr:hypothetical protein FOL47_004208 [Perkinsus chesapeaki]
MGDSSIAMVASMCGSLLAIAAKIIQEEYWGLEFIGGDVSQSAAAGGGIPVLCGIIGADGYLEKRTDALPPLPSQPPQPVSLSSSSVPTINSPPVVSTLDEDATVGVIAQDCRELAMQCLSILCARDQKRMRQLRHCDGVKLITRQLQREPIPAPSTTWRFADDEENDGDVDGTLSMGICAVDCVWSCIVGSKKSEESFIINYNGVGHLLECFEVAPRVLKRQILGCVSDLLNNCRFARHQFLQWNSPVTLKSAVKLLLELLIREQKAVGAIDVDGTMIDVCRPWNPIGESDLVGEESKSDSNENEGKENMNTDEPFQSRSEGGGSPMVFYTGDMNDMRMRIYCLLSVAIGFNSVEETEATDPAKTSTDSLQSSKGMKYSVLKKELLTLKEKQQLEAIRLYPELRELELWQDLRDFLKVGGAIEPAVGDVKWIEDNIEVNLTRSCWAKNIQKDMLLAEEKAEFADMLMSIESQVSAEGAGQHLGIRYSDTYSDSELMLLELPEGLEVGVKEGQEKRILVVKGGHSDGAVACIEGRSYEVKSLNNSNSRLICRLEDGRINVECNQQDMFVLEPIAPRINEAAIASVLESDNVDGVSDRKRLKCELQASDEEIDAFIDAPESNIVADEEGRLIVMDENYIVEALDLVLSVLPECCEEADEGGRISVDVEECWQSLDSVCEAEGRQTPALCIVARLLATVATDETAKSKTSVDLDEGKTRVARATQIICQRRELSLREFDHLFTQAVANTIGCRVDEGEERDEEKIRELIYSMVRDKVVVDDGVSPAVVKYIDRSSLPSEPRARMKVLLSLRKYWDSDSLSRWIKDEAVSDGNWRGLH